jgi:hypothetical protein
MARIYYGRHDDWAFPRAPEFRNASSVGAAASMLRPFVKDEIVPQKPVPAPSFSELDRELDQLLDHTGHFQWLLQERGFEHPFISKLKSLESDLLNLDFSSLESQSLQPVKLRAIPDGSDDVSDPELLSSLKRGYELVVSLEVRLQRYVVQGLKDQYGEEEAWTKGVTQETRKRCSQRKEEDDNRCDGWSYFNFLDLQRIIETRWDLFKSDAERLEKFPGKPQFLKQFVMINTLRNQIMHPLKRKPLGPDDFQFFTSFSAMIDELVGKT